MAEDLQSIESELLLEYSAPHNSLMVFGLPRSGTTLLTQLLQSNSSVHALTNFEARFWFAPLVGARLWRETENEHLPLSLTSHFGQTVETHGPHEFSNFWRRYAPLPKEIFPGGGTMTSSLAIELARVLAARAAIHETTVVYKPMEYFAWNTDMFKEWVPNTVAVFMVRRPSDVLNSVTAAIQKVWCPKPLGRRCQRLSALILKTEWSRWLPVTGTFIEKRL